MSSARRAPVPPSDNNAALFRLQRVQVVQQRVVEEPIREAGLALGVELLVGRQGVRDLSLGQGYRTCARSRTYYGRNVGDGGQVDFCHAVLLGDGAVAGRAAVHCPWPIEDDAASLDRMSSARGAGNNGPLRALSS